MQVPELLNDRYQVLGPIGTGGMGAVFKARDKRIAARLVALKFLREDIDDEHVRERFKQEAHAAGGLSHENIVRIFDVGEWNGLPFIVMEYVQGETIADRIKGKQGLPVLEALELVEQLCDGLAYAHGAGIIHRDIKPSNLIVDASTSRLKILDFGIAKVSDSALTGRDILGSVNYMSPEQLQGGSIDRRSDIFAVGSVLYEALSGRRAFPGTIHDGLLARIVAKPVEPLSSLVANLDPQIERIVEKALQKLPADRYQDLQGMRRDLRQVRQRLVSTRIDELLAEGQQSFETGKLDRALLTCDEILHLNADDTRGHDLRQRIERAKAEQGARAMVEQARAYVDAGELTEAQLLLARARTLGSEADDADALSNELVRRKAANEALRLSAQQLAEGNAEAALVAANEALRLVPGAPEAVEARDKAEALRQEQEREAAARLAVASANTSFSQGRHTEAIEILERFQPQHELVDSALRQLRVEAERARTRHELDRLVDDATRAIDLGNVTSARALMRQAQRLNPFEPHLDALEGRIHSLEKAREERMQAALREAERLAGAGQFDEALAALDALDQKPAAVVQRVADIERQRAQFEAEQTVVPGLRQTEGREGPSPFGDTLLIPPTAVDPAAADLGSDATIVRTPRPRPTGPGSVPPRTAATPPPPAADLAKTAVHPAAGAPAVSNRREPSREPSPPPPRQPAAIDAQARSTHPAAFVDVSKPVAPTPEADRSGERAWLPDVVTSRPAALAAGLAVLLLAVVVVWWAIMPSSDTSQTERLAVPSVPVAIDAVPWANVTIEGESPDMRQSSLVTPFVTMLAPGTYTLTLDKGDGSQPMTRSIRVTPDGQNSHVIAMPGHDASKTSADFLNGLQ